MALFRFKINQLKLLLKQESLLNTAVLDSISHDNSEQQIGRSAMYRHIQDLTCTDHPVFDTCKKYTT